MAESNPISFNANRLKRSPEDIAQEIAEHAGKIVARSRDGVDVVAYASTYGELFEMLKQQKVRVQDVVIGVVESADSDDIS